MSRLARGRWRRDARNGVAGGAAGDSGLRGAAIRVAGGGICRAGDDAVVVALARPICPIAGRGGSAESSRECAGDAAGGGRASVGGAPVVLTVVGGRIYYPRLNLRK